MRRRLQEVGGCDCGGGGGGDVDGGGVLSMFEVTITFHSFNDDCRPNELCH